MDKMKIKNIFIIQRDCSNARKKKYNCLKLRRKCSTSLTIKYMQLIRYLSPIQLTKVKNAPNTQCQRRYVEHTPPHVPSNSANWCNDFKGA